MKVMRYRQEVRACKNVASDVHGLRSTKLTLKIYPTGKAVIIVRFTYASGNVDLIIELWIVDGKLMGCYANDRALVPHRVSATPMQCAPPGQCVSHPVRSAYHIGRASP